MRLQHVTCSASASALRSYYHNHLVRFLANISDKNSISIIHNDVHIKKNHSQHYNYCFRSYNNSMTRNGERRVSASHFSSSASAASNNNDDNSNNNNNNGNDDNNSSWWQLLNRKSSSSSTNTSSSTHNNGSSNNSSNGNNNNSNNNNNKGSSTSSSNALINPLSAADR